MGAYANANAGTVPREVYEAWPEATQLLFRHRAEGVRGSIVRGMRGNFHLEPL